MVHCIPEERKLSSTSPCNSEARPLSIMRVPKPLLSGALTGGPPVSAILLVQWLILMPRLDERTLALIAGAVVEPSSLHHWWIILDVARMGIYAWVLRKAAHYLLSSEPKDRLES